MPWLDGWPATIASPCPRTWLALDRLSSHGTCSTRCTRFGATGRSPVLGYMAIISSILFSLLGATSYEGSTISFSTSRSHSASQRVPAQESHRS